MPLSVKGAVARSDEVVVMWFHAPCLACVFALLVALPGCTLANSAGSREVTVTLTEFSIEASA